MTASPALLQPMRRVLRVGGIAAAVFLPLAALVGRVLAGEPGLWAGLLGAAVPVAFLGVTVVVAIVSARLAPTALGAVVLGSWLVKVVLLVAVLAGLRAADFYDRTTFGVVLLLGTAGALALEALVVVRTRVAYVDPVSTDPDRS